MEIGGCCGCNCFHHNHKEEEVRCCCSSYKNWNRLPLDLKADILSRLPPKQLIRFKLVSKSSCSEVSALVCRICPPGPSAPLLGMLYHSKMTDTGYESTTYVPSIPSPGPYILIHLRYESVLPFSPTPEDLLDCCNGLLLFCRSSPLPVEYYVTNPITRQCFPIPLHPLHCEPEHKHALLAFDPSQSLNFKIIRLEQSPLHSSVGDPPRLHLFSSETGEWVLHAVPMDPKVYGHSWKHRGAYLNGVLYLLSSAKYLLALDLRGAENVVTARAIELPDRDRIDEDGSFGVSKGCLFYSNHDGHRIMIFSLRNDDGIWNLKHSLSIDQLIVLLRNGLCHGFPASAWLRTRHLVTQLEALIAQLECRALDQLPSSSMVKPHAFHPTSEVIFLGIPSVVFSYNLKTQQLEAFFQILSFRTINMSPYLVFPFSSSLVFLKNFNWKRSLLNVLLHNSTLSHLTKSDLYQCIGV